MMDKKSSEIQNHSYKSEAEKESLFSPGKVCYHNSGVNLFILDQDRMIFQ